ncbi:MAG: hypothetical protein FK733_02360 [Asgard group archaeon]|nr:hypothetical protein [Asgard group archaeon]
MSKEKSPQFKKFEHYFFELEIPPNAILGQYIDIWTIDQLSSEEKLIAEDMLIEALSYEIRKVWLYGLAEMQTEKAYDFLMNLFEKEKDLYSKTQLSFSLVTIKLGAPVLDFINKIIYSNEPERIKYSAMSTLYWLKNAQYEEQEMNDFYETILYSAMIDKNMKVRKYAYEILQERFKMDEFTSFDDPILKLLSEDGKKKDYQNAVSLFKRNVESKEIIPVNRKTIANFINNLPNNPPIIDISNCEICSTIKDKEYADIEKDESLDSITKKLETIITIAYYKDCIKRCPICGRLYSYDYHYEYFACSDNDEEETLTRTDSKGAMAHIDLYLKAYDFKKIIIVSYFLKIDY